MEKKQIQDTLTFLFNDLEPNNNTNILTNLLLSNKQAKDVLLNNFAQILPYNDNDTVDTYFSENNLPNPLNEVPSPYLIDQNQIIYSDRDSYSTFDRSNLKSFFYYFYQSSDNEDRKQLLSNALSLIVDLDVFFLLKKDILIYDDLFLDAFKKYDSSIIDKYLFSCFFKTGIKSSLSEIDFIKIYKEQSFYDFINKIQFSITKNSTLSEYDPTALNYSFYIANKNLLSYYINLIASFNLNTNKANVFIKNLFYFSLNTFNCLYYNKNLFSELMSSVSSHDINCQPILYPFYHRKSGKGKRKIYNMDLTLEEKDILESKGFIIYENIINSNNKKSLSAFLLREEINLFFSFNVSYDQPKNHFEPFKKSYKNYVIKNNSYLKYFIKDNNSFDFLLYILNLANCNEKDPLFLTALYADITLIPFDKFLLLFDDKGYIIPEWKQMLTQQLSNINL